MIPAARIANHTGRPDPKAGATTAEIEGRFEFESMPSDRRLTHYLFRFPAKFHPPVARALLERYADADRRVLDPFCGSGTLLIEAAVSGLSAIGSDVDPLAVFVSQVKSRPLQASALEKSWAMLWPRIERWRRTPADYQRMRFEDISSAEMLEETARLGRPKIPNLEHWFRRYVVVDLARIRREIRSVPIPQTHRAFFELCFASIIRASSNADPVPVSGLEVTSYMKRRDEAGRTVDPFALLLRATRRAIIDMGAFESAATKPVAVSAFRADATRVSGRLRAPVGAVITSPPYHGAVDYYRRHQLEMFWLDLTNDQTDRLKLLERYIGRPKVPMSHEYVTGSAIRARGARALETRIRDVSPSRADAFKHYCEAMRRVFVSLGRVLPTGAAAVFILGHSTWNGDQLDTSELFAEVAGDLFELDEVLWYPVSNRYMSYSRRNGASIDREHVVALRRVRDRSVFSMAGPAKGMARPEEMRGR